VVERLRGFGLIPVLSFTSLTVLAAIVVIVINASRFWLIGTVILGGSVILIFFSSGLAWRLLLTNRRS
jgi:hypothetical protein